MRGGGSGGSVARGVPSGGGISRGGQSFNGNSIGRNPGTSTGNNGGNWNQQAFRNGNWSGNGNWNGNSNWNGNGNWNGNNHWNDGHNNGWGYPGAWGLALGLGWGLGGRGYGGYGYGGYPYGGDDYATDYPSYYVQPAVNYPVVQAIPDVASVPPADAVQPTTAQAPLEANPTAAQSYFDQALVAFRSGDYRAALRAAAHAGIEDPKNARTHELASLALFASGEYRGAAIEAHAALALGPASNWDAIVAYYGGVNEQFTTQLRSLERFSSEKPQAAEAQFLLGYLYQGMGYAEQSKSRFAEAARLAPKDELANKLAGLTSAGATATPINSTPAAPTTPINSPPAAPKAVPASPTPNPPMGPNQ